MRHILITKDEDRDGYLKLTDEVNNFRVIFPVEEFLTVVQAISGAIKEFRYDHAKDYNLNSSKILDEYNMSCSHNRRIYSNWISKYRAYKILTHLFNFWVTNIGEIPKDKYSKKDFIKSLPAQVLVGLYNNKKGEKNEESCS